MQRVVRLVCLVVPELVRQFLFRNFVTIRVSRVQDHGAAVFHRNAIQPLEDVVAEAQAVARRSRHGRQAAVAFFPVAVGVALRVGLRAERPALAGEAGADLLKMKVSSLAGHNSISRFD